MRNLALLTVVLSASLVKCSSGTKDQRAEALSYAREDIACTKDSDCCVVFDMCLNRGYVVGAADQATVANLIATADQTTCNRCMPPPVEISCGASGFCVGTKLGCGHGSTASANHCGKVTTVDGGCPTAAPLSIEPTAPGKKPQTVIGCGS
jgi:hypothetical protein